MEEVVAPLLHNSVPVNEPAVRTELLQLLTTETVGAVTVEFIGAAMPLPEELGHPLTVCATVYVPAVATTMEELVEPLLHSNEPVNEPAVSVELPQLFTTDTDGAAGIALTVNVAAIELVDPVLLLHTARYCFPLSVVVVAKVNVPLVAPLTFVQVVPLVLDCHCTVGVPPVAAEVKLALFPAQTVCEAGCVVTVGDGVPPEVKTTSAQ